MAYGLSNGHVNDDVTWPWSLHVTLKGQTSDPNMKVPGIDVCIFFTGDSRFPAFICFIYTELHANKKLVSDYWITIQS